MNLREQIKKEIDLIPEEYLPKITVYLDMLKRKKSKKREIKTISLKGKYDNLNVRELVYE